MSWNSPTRWFQSRKQINTIAAFRPWHSRFPRSRLDDGIGRLFPPPPSTHPLRRRDDNTETCVVFPKLHKNSSSLARNESGIENVKVNRKPQSVVNWLDKVKKTLGGCFMQFENGYITEFLLSYLKVILSFSNHIFYRRIQIHVWTLTPSNYLKQYKVNVDLL